MSFFDTYINPKPMKDIETLSNLPASTLEVIRLALNVVYVMDPIKSKQAGIICDQVNKALEMKQEYYFTAYDDLTENNPIGI